MEKYRIHPYLYLFPKSKVLTNNDYVVCGYKKGYQVTSDWNTLEAVVWNLSPDDFHIVSNSPPRQPKGKFVYIATPYSSSLNKEQTLQYTIWLCNEITRMGLFPYNPLFSHYMHLENEKYLKPLRYTKADYMMDDLGWIKKCDIFLFNGFSKGTIFELRHANKLGLTILVGYHDLKSYIEEVEI